MAESSINQREAKYFSSYTGEEIDETITYVRKMMTDSPDHIVESTVDAKIDLNTMVEKGNYFIQYYTNSYDDTASGDQIKLTVIVLDEEIRQIYTYLGKTVTRIYDKTKKTWGAWCIDAEFIIAEKGETIHVTKPTIVFQKA